MRVDIYEWTHRGIRERTRWVEVPSPAPPVYREPIPIPLTAVVLDTSLALSPVIETRTFDLLPRWDGTGRAYAEREPAVLPPPPPPSDPYVVPATPELIAVIEREKAAAKLRPHFLGGRPRFRASLDEDEDSDWEWYTYVEDEAFDRDIRRFYEYRVGGQERAQYLAERFAHLCNLLFKPLTG